MKLIIFLMCSVGFHILAQIVTCFVNWDLGWFFLSELTAGEMVGYITMCFIVVPIAYIVISNKTKGLGVQ